MEFCFSWVFLVRIIIISRNRARKKFKELLSPSFFPKQTQPYKKYTYFLPNVPTCF